MKTRSILALTVASVAALGTAYILPVSADDSHGGAAGRGAGPQAGMMGPGGQSGPMGGHGGMDMTQMFRMMHGGGGMMGGMGPGGMGPGGMGMMGGTGMMGGGGMMGSELFEAFDADDDGTVTPEEARTGLRGQLETYDADGDGTLSIEEFQTLHAAVIRNQMVDRFQALDEDGDGKVTADEIAAPARQMERLERMRGAFGQAQQPDGDGDREGGAMMNRN